MPMIMASLFTKRVDGNVHSKLLPFISEWEAFEDMARWVHLVSSLFGVSFRGEYQGVSSRRSIKLSSK